MLISVNLAISADGKISSSRRFSGWASELDRQRLKTLREGAGALLVGRGTLETDRMTLQNPGDPWRCVVSRRGIFDLSQPLFNTDGGPIHLLATEGPAPEIPRAKGHTGSLDSFLGELHRSGIEELLCEGGGMLVKELAALDLIDTIHLTWVGHTLAGGLNAPTMTGVPGDFLPASRQYELTDFEPHPETGECFLSYRRVVSANSV